MEVRKQAFNRVIDALSPALASELDRVVRETREILEQEFGVRLEAAVSEAKAAAASAEAQLERSVEQAKEEARRQVTAELEQRFNERLEAATTRIKSESAEERMQLQTQLEQWRTFAETQWQLAEASSQPEILSRFLRLGEPFAAGLALYVTKPEGLALWKSKGKGVFPEIISQESTDPVSYFRTISIRDRTVGAICAAPSFKRDALDFMAASLERAIEAFGLKLRAPVPKAAAS